MSTNASTVFERILQLTARFGTEQSGKYANEEPPLRSELFSVEQMEQHGKTLAAVHRLTPGLAPEGLLSRLAGNESFLIGVSDLLAAALKANRRITPAGEWLLDNFYLIEEQVRTAKRHLPKDYSRELPRLAAGPSIGFPRVYDIALHAISHGDGRVDAESLRRFVAAYQTVNDLKLGELWAIPIMLRLALIENLRRVAARIAAGTLDRNRADGWADQMLQVAEHDPKSLILVIADMARSGPPMVSSFVAELARRLQGQSSALALPLTWIEQRLAESGSTIEALVQLETQGQAADQVSISNSIGSLRFLAVMDWREFVEDMSLVERQLVEDPGGTYREMDFATRDLYRHSVEAVAKRSPISESDVAGKAVALARHVAMEKGAGDRAAHVGYYLIDAGRPQLERSAKMQRSLLDRLRRAAEGLPLLLYLGSVSLITIALSVALLLHALAAFVPVAWLPLIGFLSIVATSQLAVALINWLATLLIAPHPLPRMDYSRGIPSAARTLVVVPTIISGAANIEALVEALEVRFLANRDRHLHFALLTDFGDAAAESLPEDDGLLNLASSGIEALNTKYAEDSTNSADGGETSGRFFLFHRPRRWNAQEQIWMGYERKRGKLSDLNAFLRGETTDRFVKITGPTAVLSDTKYVVTLDSDTQLPRDAARQFVGAMAHPLNRAQFAMEKTADGKPLVTHGYGILQPRVSASLPGTNRSWYARLYAGESGIDPYTRSVSDVYQDVFREGSFIGKGIYDVDAFEQALDGQFPENRILSHDLLEGCYAGSGLVSDAHVYEEYPSRYHMDVLRRYRWIRGDWQIAGWLLPTVPGPNGRRRSNPLSPLSLWKVFDNLRRSLVPAALTLLLLAGWLIPGVAIFWTLVALSILMLPPLAGSIVDLLRRQREMPMVQHLASAAGSAGRHLAQAVLALAFLPYEAWFSTDAALRTTWRVVVTRRRLLEWQASGGSDASSEDDGAGLKSAFASMWMGPALGAAVAVYLDATVPSTFTVAAPILLLWCVSPAIAWYISCPIVRREANLAPGDAAFVRRMARKTWAFFDTFVGPEDHWLPPDNYQEHPLAMLTQRTSPTNMGLALLANLSAYDFGYIPAGQLVQRTSDALASMRTLERYHGHFYNWYDTRSCKPLLPLYVSSVDSGNLAGHLLTLRAGLLALPDDPIVDSRVLMGARDTLGIVTDAWKAEIPATAGVQDTLDAACAGNAVSITEVRSCLERLAAFAAGLTTDGNVSSAQTIPAPSDDGNWWAGALLAQCRAQASALALLAPWTTLPPAPPGIEGWPQGDAIPTLRELATGDNVFRAAIARHRLTGITQPGAAWLDAFENAINLAGNAARDRIECIERLAKEAGDLARMEYDFLTEPSCHLLAIGYDVGERRRDPSYYDLLASEARLGTFVAIAQGELPQASWFALGRLLTTAGGASILLSWSGSMFEYLMPLLVMPTYESTLLDQTYRAAVARQIAYANQRGVPWGMSESGYNTVDAALNYQYRAFGVPGLGLKRGLGEELVIAPYASALALMVAPAAACLNLRRLAADGLEGKFGMYEAVDYTSTRVPRGQKSVVVRSFMAHHQGMSLLAFSHLLLDRPMQRRFASEPLFKATMLLLQERVPKVSMLHVHTADVSPTRAMGGGPETLMRVITNPDTPNPHVQLLSNGRYHVMVSSAGSGYSRFRDIAVTRWREDATSDDRGAFCYLRDVASGKFWSTAYQPTLARADKYEAIFSEGRAEFRRRDHGIESHTEIVVSPEDDIELRRVRITNRSRARRTVEVTTYAEVVLAAPAADALHPAFSNLFIQTEIVPARRAILCTRRPRSRAENPPWLLHVMTAHGTQAREISYETDRMRFIGRGRTVAEPQAMIDQGALSGSEGSVLDPIVSIRCRIVLDPQESATVDMVTGIGETREGALSLVEKYHDRHLADRVFDLAWTHSWVTLRQINATESDAQLYGRLGGSVIHANAALRADPGVLLRNRRGQSGLWSYAISGDLPIVLLQISDAANIDLVRQLVQAHAYWRIKGLAVDLVIWNEDHGGYRQVLQEQIMGLIAAGIETHVMDRPGGIFVRRAEQIAEEDRILLQAVARVIITDRRGTLADQIARRGPPEIRVPRITPIRDSRDVMPSAMASPTLILGNGLGGFSPDGTEYVITMGPGVTTPAPWVNVIANADFGTVVSENGTGYTWSENAHEFRLTPWHNDPVSDASGEAIYLRDEQTGHFWSPGPQPARGTGTYVCRHGFGYSVFDCDESGIESKLTVYVALDEAVKFSVLRIRNRSGRARRLSATGYVEWVLGDLRPKTSMHVVSEQAPDGAVMARNAYNTEFVGRTAFFDVDDPVRTVTGDRAEFLGRNQTARTPAAMERTRLSGRTGAALDPCAAIQVPFELFDGEERTIVFRLGVGRDGEDATRLIHKFRTVAVARTELDQVRRHWKRTLSTVQVTTPDPAIDVLANGWLLYQTLSCRLWARSGYYQSGGAFGFRDQLQDVMALVYAQPHLVREHLVRCAGRQFDAGDVQHWWHPPSGRGVRTHCSDDYLWLPLAVCRYIAVTGDAGVLDESAHFLDGREVSPGDDSYYDLPGLSPNSADVYGHCVRAILHGLRFGVHGLPLMGSGDWNDGMDRVGAGGKGESVWLAFFLYEVLTRFSEIAAMRNDAAFAERCRTEAAQLRARAEGQGWDGSWYRRAYFDDGTPLGSATNAECQIDSIAQSWSVLSGSGDPARATRALDAVYERLVRGDRGLIQLLDPPLDRSDVDPGYIRGYVPGVRENGGQYTHAAIWAAMAFAELGDAARAWELTAMINPVNHARDAEAVATYKVEPYVVAADVYAVPPHIGRGGWSWYTGSAGWLYRLFLESLLGLRVEGERLHLLPCLPADWKSFKISYRFKDTVYQVNVLQESARGGQALVTLDGERVEDAVIVMVDDRQAHVVEWTCATRARSQTSASSNLVPLVPSSARRRGPSAVPFQATGFPPPRE